MEVKLILLKASVAAFFTALSAFLGWQGVLACIWVVVVALDYISGTVAAWMTGQWASGIAREGAMHKLGMLFTVIVAGVTDITLVVACEHLPLGWEWPVLLLPLVFAWYILTELGSILENAVKMGAPIPDWLMNLLSVGLKAINAKGDNLAEASLDDPGGEDK